MRSGSCDQADLIEIEASDASQFEHDAFQHDAKRLRIKRGSASRVLRFLAQRRPFTLANSACRKACRNRRGYEMLNPGALRLGGALEAASTRMRAYDFGGEVGKARRPDG
jgi:hypothetical protein